MDDQQAREAAAKALFAIEEPDLNHFRWNRENPNDPDGPLAWHNYWLKAATAAIDAYLGALPVAPEQPTQANEGAALMSVLRSNLNGERAAALVGLDPEDYEEQIAGTDEVVDMIAALVSSPSVETVTPDRETIIREVLDWMVSEDANYGMDRHSVVHAAREHFGVSS